jgi:predicted Zn-dependent protease
MMVGGLRLAVGGWTLAFLLFASCTNKPKPETAHEHSVREDTGKTETMKVPKIDMAAELAKIDTMLKTDSLNATIAHESYLRALDMMEGDKIIFAELFYKRALAHEPTSHFLLSELIKVLLRQNKTDEALPLLKLAVQSPKATADNFLFMARFYKESENLDSAAIYYKKTTDKMGENYAVWYEYAQLLELSLRKYEPEKKKQELEKIYQELKRVYDVLLVELDYPPQLLERQILLYQITATPDSATAFLLGEAFKANGIKYAEYGYLQAEILSFLKKYNEANEILSAIFFMHPSEKFKSRIALKIANNYELMDSVTIAISWLEQLLTQEPENHIAMNNLGYILIDHDIDVNEGLYLVEKALSYSPEEFSYLDSKAWGLYKIGKYEESLEIFEKLEARGRDIDELWLHLAKVCEALQLHERAKGYMAKIKVEN